MNPDPASARTAPGAISELLAQWHAGDRGALDQLFPLVYRELRARARGQLARQPSSLLGPTALVHETFLKLVDAAQASWADRNHFFAVASLAMRQILVDAARRKLADKRGAGQSAEPLDEAAHGWAGPARELLELDEALEELRAVDPRLVRVVELRFFGGLSFEETAEVLELSPRTAKRDWRKARALLQRALLPAGEA